MIAGIVRRTSASYAGDYGRKPVPACDAVERADVYVRLMRENGRHPAAAIAAHALQKTYGSERMAVRALRGVDMSVAPGEFVAIMGPSGSGKSTMLHILGALESPTAGTVSLDGRRYDGLDDGELTRLRRDTIGFVFQFFNLLPSLTAAENVHLPALIAGRRGDDLRRRALALLARVGLADRADHLPSELSGGEQQRVSIARALLLSPRLVLADEPTGNLDSRAGHGVLDLLRDVNRSDSHTIVMVTHDPAAAAVADRIVFLRDGEIAGEIKGGDTQRAAEFLASLDTGAPAPA
jgi:putative ABC transport system ATP-binding protein